MWQNLVNTILQRYIDFNAILKSLKTPKFPKLEISYFKIQILSIGGEYIIDVNYKFVSS